MDIQLNCTACNVSTNTNRVMTVDLSDIDKSEVLDHFKVEDCVDHFNVNDFLEYIGVDAAKKYFDLIDNTD